MSSQGASLFVGEESPVDELLARLRGRTARIGVVGLGYVGLPLALELAGSFPVFGFDADAARVASLGRGQSHIIDIPALRIQERLQQGSFEATVDPSLLAECDAIIICVPTPLERGKDPDLSYIREAASKIAAHLRPGQLIVLESTTYPGTTDEVLLPLFTATGLRLDEEFLLAFSPERVDPGNKRYELRDIPKVVGGTSELSTIAASELYETIVPHVHRVSSSRAAEATKLLENTFRLVNIGLVNEIALLCKRLGIDTNEVIEAAATKPFGFMPFYPGPGVGGHCIPLDPLYLSWKARQEGFISRFIGLADEINSDMPEYVVQLAIDGLNSQGKAVRDARILLLGVAYKEDIDDARHSPAIPIVDRLRARGAAVSYHDPHIPRFDMSAEDWPEWRPRPRVQYERRRRLSAANPGEHARRRNDPLESVALTDQRIADADCIIILTRHSSVDYSRVAANANLIVDVRNALGHGSHDTSKAQVVRL